jgi:hypothetical protein
VQCAFEGHHTHLHLYPTSDAIVENAVVSLNAPGTLIAACTGPDAVSFYTLKAAHFTPNLRPAYHYAIFAHYNTCDSTTDCPHCPATAKSEASPKFGRTGIGELPGNDFIVSLGALVDQGVTVMPDIVNAGTFMHELGHNLSLHHGGNDDFDQKPNYISVMNHSYQFGIGSTTSPGPYPTSEVDPSATYRIDYSTFGGFGALREGRSNGANACISDGSGGMSEPAGLVSGPSTDTDVVIFYANAGNTSVYGPSNATAVDWDDTPPATDLNVYADVSGDGACSVLNAFDDWTQTSSAGVTHDTALSLGFQCNTGFWADGAPPPSQLEDREFTAPMVLAKHQVYPFLHVKIDVRPHCDTNAIALGSPATVEVAVLGSATFDVTKVDRTSLRFAGAAPRSTQIRDVNHDGRDDLVGNFAMNSLHLSPASTTASLVGALRSSQAFGGTDSITLVSHPDNGCPDKK